MALIQDSDTLSFTQNHVIGSCWMFSEYLQDNGQTYLGDIGDAAPIQARESIPSAHGWWIEVIEAHKKKHGIHGLHWLHSFPLEILGFNMFQV